MKMSLSRLIIILFLLLFSFLTLVPNIIASSDIDELVIVRYADEPRPTGPTVGKEKPGITLL